MYETLRRYLFLALAQKLVLLPSWNEIYIEFIRASLFVAFEIKFELIDMAIAPTEA